MSSIPRPEYPRPQLVRTDWINLNGEWEFEMDPSASGRERGLYQAEHLKDRILVPFCPESPLSGIGYKDFMTCVWYLREVELPEDWRRGAQERGERIYLHFGAVDYRATVYVNGQEAAKHVGGYSPFSIDITAQAAAEKLAIALCAEDDVRSGRQPGGKQSGRYASFGCFYTRTTGIWQTVWLERVPKNHIRSVHIYPDAENARVRISVQVAGAGTLAAEASYRGQPMGADRVQARDGAADLLIPLREAHFWEPGHGRLYDLKLTFEEDAADSYFGLRSLRLADGGLWMNSRPVFQRLVLDQGFYPDGIYTAPTEETLVKDIELSLAAGFNGARLHEKAFEPRFLYHCDRMGYMVWGEHGNWNLDVSDLQALAAYLPEWTELVERDFNHPAIIGWSPFNETWDTDGRKQRDEILSILYRMTKRLDPTRPCIDTSGNYHVETDIFDVHDYEQKPEIFRARYQRLLTENVLEDAYADRQTYGGQPVFISEYGGIKWDVDGGIEGWGYGDGPGTEEEFLARYKGLTEAILENPKLCGFCYTQLYDVEQEKNGLYTYHRVPKFDMEIIRRINTGRAAMEESVEIIRSGGGRG